MIQNRTPLVSKKAMLAGIFLLVASLVLAAFMMQPSAADLLTGALETMEGVVDGHAVVELELNMPEMADGMSGGSATVELWGRMGEGDGQKPAFRMEVLAASEGEAVGATAVSDGSTLWLWHPSENTVYTGTTEELAQLLERTLQEKLDGQSFEHADKEAYPDVEIPETAEEAVAHLLGYFTAERNGTAKIGDSTAYQIRLVPIPEQMPDEVRAAGGFLNVWIDAQSNAPLGAEYAEGAVGYAKVMATTLELNQGIDDGVFDFEIPEGAAVIQLVDLATLAMAAAEEAAPSDAADFEMLSPGYLPADAKLLDTSQVRGATVQRYALADGDFFTIAQGPAGISYQPDGVGTSVSVRGVSATLFANNDGARAMLTWTEGERSVWVGGDLSVDELTAVAESLR